MVVLLPPTDQEQDREDLKLQLHGLIAKFELAVIDRCIWKDQPIPGSELTGIENLNQTRGELLQAIKEELITSHAIGYQRGWDAAFYEYCGPGANDE